VRIAWSDYAKPEAIDAETFGYRWDPQHTGQTGADSQALVRLPEYYRLTSDDKGKSRWEPVAASDVPQKPGFRMYDLNVPRDPKLNPMCHSLTTLTAAGRNPVQPLVLSRHFLETAALIYMVLVSIRQISRPFRTPT
jgi:hypothetical protein